VAKETRAKVTINSQFGGLHAAAAANPATLSAGFASLFPAGVVAAELRTPGDPSLLWPEEALAVEKAVPKRVQEFAAGRLCARRALAEFGVRDFALRAAPDRRPVWPELLVGSITHTAGLCAAVVAERGHLVALGLDTETAGAVKTELWPSICVAEEVTWLESLGAAARAVAATMIFSAKEAFYKCQYPVTEQRLNFSDLHVTALDWGGLQGSFAVSPTRPIAVFARSPVVPSIRGAYRLHEGFISAGVYLAAG
jgi:4'-phosphopantetheinyl transferase EntD